MGIAQAFAQYPKHFVYDNENGLPGSEVYSIVQDNKGFIWIGCDAGLYKFDGVRYTLYKSPAQKAKSITGLTFSSSGRLYCYNFQSQIFFLGNDTLRELKHNLPDIPVINLVSDRTGNVYVSHGGGIFCYNENRKQWNNYFDYQPGDIFNTNQWAAKTIKGSLRDTIAFIYAKGIAKIENRGVKHIHGNELFQQASLGTFEIELHQNTLWIFQKENGTVYRFANNRLEEITHSKLNEILAGRKITNVKSLPDGNLWICTYKGIVCYNTQAGKAELFYPKYSFSDCLIDLEGNYWFTTLQASILRVQNLDYLVWNDFENNHLTKITTDGQHIYFAALNGTVGKLNTQNNALQFFNTDSDADIQSLDFDVNDKALWFYVNNSLYTLKNNSVQKQVETVRPVKARLCIGNTCFWATSHGTFINGIKADARWARQLCYDSITRQVWAATNSGLICFEYINGEWNLSQTLLPAIQILSIDFDTNSRELYVLTFDGKIVAVNRGNKIVDILQLPADIQANKLKLYHGKLYLATNTGIGIYEPAPHQQAPGKTGLKLINRLSGLVSDNVQDICMLNETLWLATGKGLQKIPLHEKEKSILAKIYLKNNYQLSIDNCQLKYNEVLILNPEVAHYSSNGNFEYAYRINPSEAYPSQSDGWIKLPANIEQIEIQNIPSGKFMIELKAIDYLGRDSENRIILKGYANPPFWLSWWFVLLVALAVAVIVFVIVKTRIQRFKQKQQKELERIQLENELQLSRETALKVQMNPHFVFNVLNSIKAYIYKNDKEKASDYLNKFSDLIRTFLNMSNKPDISVADELKMLDLYIGMEAMLLKNDFSYAKNIDAAIDLHQTRIPSLIIQPFIENVFKHGLHHKENNKKLTLCINQTAQNVITITICDNGIGRTAARKIKQAQAGYESFATTAIEKRIELLNRNRQTVSVFIEDLFDEHHNPGGTIVTLKIILDE